VSKPRLFGLTASIIVVVSVFGLLPRLGAQLGETAKAPESTKEGRDGLYRPLGLFTEVLSLVRSNYVEPVDVKPLLSGAFSGMTEAMDPFAEYIPADKLAAFRAAEAALEKGETIDSGVVLARRLGYPLVVSAVAGGPAAKGGLESDDIIEKIGSQPVHEVPLWEVRSRLSGKPGTKVQILVVREGKPRHRTIDIVLSSWAPESPAARRISGEMVVRVPDFAPGTAAALKAIVAPLDRTRPLLVDIRGNAFGSYEEAVRAAALFVAPGPIGELKGRKVEGKAWTAGAGERIHESRIVLLVDSGTGGPAELFAAAVRESDKTASQAEKKVRLVGEPTFGMGSAQQVVPLASGGALRLSVAKVRTAGGRALPPKGIDPDDRVYTVPQEDTHGDPALDMILQRGIKALAEAGRGQKSAS
jgi:carboxyl-terminal processing protease